MGQKLETHRLDPQTIVRVETAQRSPHRDRSRRSGDDGRGGQPERFHVERRENKVFVKPTEDGAKTNLFIWTTQGRYAYELVPAGSCRADALRHRSKGDCG